MNTEPASMRARLQHIVSVLSVRRAFWMLAYPFCLIGNKFGASYKWVNVGKGAWHPEWFDPLWHWRWYGTQIEQMPETVNLCGIRYHVSVAEGLVTFVDRVSGTRLSFERDPHDRYADLWYCDPGRRFPATHFREAYEWIQAVYGGSHVKKRAAVAR